MGLRDVLAVPQDVRRALATALPAGEYTVYAASAHHVCAVTHQDDAPHEVYVPHATARNRPEAVAALVASRGCRDRLETLLPHGADPRLPLCRDVWWVSRGRPWKQCALDVLFGGDVPEFPMRANVLVFSADDLHTPLGVECDVVVRYEKT